MFFFGISFGLNPPDLLPLLLLFYDMLLALTPPMIEALWPTTVPLLVVCSRLLPSLGPRVGSGILSCWNFALCLERETTMGQCLVLYLLISFLFLFASGFVCEPHDEMKAYIPPVELPPPLPGNG